CVILGSFPATEWNDAQFRALLKYVEEGAAVIFLGGEKSFGRGGYAATPLAGLFPWPISETEPALSSGVFPVNVPATAAGSPVVANVRELLEHAGATVESLNGIGSAKPGAMVLLNANAGARNAALAAVQPFGKGKAL